MLSADNAREEVDNSQHTPTRKPLQGLRSLILPKLSLQGVIASRRSATHVYE